MRSRPSDSTTASTESSHSCVSTGSLSGRSAAIAPLQRSEAFRQSPPDTLPGDVDSGPGTHHARRCRRAAAQLRAATELLEAVARDRGLLGTLTVEERARLLTAAADVFDPDVVQRRRYTKEKRKQERDASIRADEAMLADTGIRVLREKPVFTTPNVYPPKDFEPATTTQRRRRARRSEEQHCYVCKQPYRELHHFYDQLCPPCAEFNFAKRSETADLEGRVAVLTGGRVKIGYQAGIKLLRAGAHADRDDAVSRATRPPATRSEPDFDDWGDRLEIYGLDLRHTPSVEAFCHHLLVDARPARLHRQQRLPDRAPAARLLPAHDGRRARVRARARRPRCSGCSATTRGCAATTCSRATRRCSPTRRSPSWSRPRPPALSQVRLLPEEDARSGPPLPRGPARPGPAAGRPPRPQLVALPARRGVDGRAARDAARQRRRAVRAQRAPEAADAAHDRTATSTSSTSRRSRASSTGASRRPGTRTRTWPRRR